MPVLSNDHLLKSERNSGRQWESSLEIAAGKRNLENSRKVVGAHLKPGSKAEGAIQKRKGEKKAILIKKPLG